MVTLTDFLLARIADDEAVAREAIARMRHVPPARIGGVGDLGIVGYPAARVLAECEWKRRIVERHVGRAYYAYRDDGTRACDECGDVVTVAWPCDTLRFLAPPYADHPDCRQEWKP